MKKFSAPSAGSEHVVTVNLIPSARDIESQEPPSSSVDKRIGTIRICFD
jgi:hypothetical protein